MPQKYIFLTPIVEMIKYFLQSVFLQLTVNFILWVFRRGGEQIIHPFPRRPDGLRKNAPTPASLPSPPTLTDWFANGTTKQTGPYSNCTIPFGHPSQPETTRISETHNITLTRRTDRPNGISDPQEQGESETAQLARAGRNERAASPPVPALARRRFRFAILFSRVSTCFDGL